MSTKKARSRAKTSTAEKIESLTPEEVYREFGDLQADIQQKVSALGTAVTSKIEKLKDLGKAITEQQERLAELHEIEKDAQKLDEYKLKAEESMNAFRRETEKVRLEWEEEKDKRDKEWQRQDEEHTYEMQMKIKRAEDQLNEMIAEKKRAEKVREQALNVQWQDREKQLKEKESEFESFREQIEKFDETLKTEINKAETIVSNKIKSQYEHQIELLKRDLESDKRLLSAKIESQTDTIESLKQTVAGLQRDLDKERQTTANVTKEALQSASGRAAMDAVQQTLQNAADSSGRKK